MNNLYSAVAAYDMTAVGPSRTTNWAEWIGAETECKCGLCNAQVLTSDYFCHYCGGGVKPRPCYHPVLPDINTPFPRQERPVEPVLIIETDKLGWQVIRVECPECHRRSHPEPRSYFAINHWNHMSPYAYDPPETKPAPKS